MDVRERALGYVLKIDSVAGQHGHDSCYRVACLLAEGFDLQEPDIRAVLHAWNKAKASPPWSDKELEHKINDAMKAASGSGKRGHLLNGKERDVKYRTANTKDDPAPVVVEAPPFPTEPIKDVREMLKACFLPGEHVSIAKAIWDEDSKRARPEHSGTVLPVEKWIEKAVGGSLEKWFGASPDAHGAYVRINPMKAGGKDEADVTAYRFACLEFDQFDMATQWQTVMQYAPPVAAVISSGGKSLHTWIRVDARNKADFLERAAELIRIFPQCDQKVVKTINRWSRLPEVWRQGKRQELLAVNLGAKDWASWKRPDVPDENSECDRFSDLGDFDVANDSNCVLGDRWLCRGGSCLWVGPSGIGKSSLTMQAAITWAMGKQFFGITPKKRALKSLIIQAENDTGDMAEEVQGVMKGLKMTRDDAFRLNDLIIIRREEAKVGVTFTDWMREQINKHKPDLVWIDPFLSYLGGDVNSQKECAHFLRVLLGPISKETNVVFMIIHHTGKPSKDKNAYKNWTASDYAYIMAGSSELTNWPRSIVYLKPNKENFMLLIPKRGKRAGLAAASGELIDARRGLPLKHGTEGIWWDYADAEPDEEKKPEEGRKYEAKRAEPSVKPPPKPRPTAFKSTLTADRFKECFEKHGGNPDEIKAELGISKSTYYRWRKDMAEDEKAAPPAEAAVPVVVEAEDDF